MCLHHLSTTAATTCCYIPADVVPGRILNTMLRIKPPNIPIAKEIRTDKNGSVMLSNLMPLLASACSICGGKRDDRQAPHQVNPCR
jgi:hypothetical protein